MQPPPTRLMIIRLRSNRLPVRALLAIVVAGATAACAKKSATDSAASPTTSASASQRRDPSVMDSTELRGGNYSTVYDAVSAKHADWLLPRGGPQAGRPPELGIWIEGQLRTRPVEYLRSIRPVDIMSIRRLSMTEALHTYSWPWGGLVITLR
jgi:hypothetical protein